ncbi:MAG TPA: cupin domain-containing protein [Allosphingosinicella sp.]|nr:cupin domain-containing protein [Allosphingosinicella sp.]
MSVLPATSEGDRDSLRAGWRDVLLSPLWESSAHQPTEAPRKGGLWSWRDIARCAHEAAKLTSPEVVERRVLRLMNPDPASAEDESTVGNLAAAIQILLPGETARPHRHSINALRFVLEGAGATTLVNGKPVEMHVGDMLLTPGDCWHEHFHAGSEPVIWLDVLDAPFHNAIGTTTFEGGPMTEPPPTLSDKAFAAPNLLPTDIEAVPPHSPVFGYPYADVARVIDHAPPGPDGARSVRYINPLTGGAAMSTLDCRMIGLDAGATTRARRTNADAVLLAVDGSGESWIGDRQYRWSKHDILVVPKNNWLRHKADSQARLFEVSNSEMLFRIDLLKEDYRD